MDIVRPLLRMDDMKIHTDHPSQHAACGARHSVQTVREEAFRLLSKDEQCKRCAQVLSAKDGGRRHYSGKVAV